MTEKYLEYANKIPKETRIATGSLSGQNDLRWAVVVALIEEGASPFSKIKEKLGVHQQRLSDTLNALQRGGLIEKQVGDELGSRYSGKYAITSFGQKMLDGFYEATEPKFKSLQEHYEFREVRNYTGVKVQTYESSDQTSKTTVATKEEIGQERLNPQIET